METLYSQSLESGPKGASTLRFVDVREIKKGIVILKNGSFRIILAVSSINFALKSTEEQEAIIAQYQAFLNSLDFPVQILVQSRRLNISPYLKLIKEKEAEQTNDLLRMQISEYTDFIKNITEVSNVMTKNFYIIVPFFPVEAHKKNIISKLLPFLAAKSFSPQDRGLFDAYEGQILQRADHINQALSGIGLNIVQLKTQEVIELLYNAYNPNIFAAEIIKDIESLEMKL